MYSIQNNKSEGKNSSQLQDMFVLSPNKKKMYYVLNVMHFFLIIYINVQSFLNPPGLGWTQLLLPAASPFGLITHGFYIVTSLISSPPCFQNHPGDNMSFLHSLFWRLFLYPHIHGASVLWGFIVKLAHWPQLHQDTNITLLTFLVSPNPFPPVHALSSSPTFETREQAPGTSEELLSSP